MTLLSTQKCIWNGVRSHVVPLMAGCSFRCRLAHDTASSFHFHRHPHLLRMPMSTSISPSKEPQIIMETIRQNTGTTEKISDETDGPCIMKLTLNRPKANAMGREFIQTLQECLDYLEDTHDTEYDGIIKMVHETKQNSPRCVVITSCSQKVFSAGADLKERATMTQDEAADFVSLLRSTMERVARLPIPVLCAIEGVAVGGGLELALAADLRIAGANAVVGLPETSLAIVPGAGGTQRLPRLIGAARAKELIWTARKINADEALTYGLVEQVVPAGDATKVAVEIGFRIAANGPIAIKASKEAIERGLECRDMKDALEIERHCYSKVLPTLDRLEGLAAFKEGRPPSYRGI